MTGKQYVKVLFAGGGQQVPKEIQAIHEQENLATSLEVVLPIDGCAEETVLDAVLESDDYIYYVTAQADEILHDEGTFSLGKTLVQSPLFREIMKQEKPQFRVKTRYNSLDLGYRRDSEHVCFRKFLLSLMAVISDYTPKQKVFIHLFPKDEDPNKAMLYEELDEEVAVLIEDFGPIFEEHNIQYYRIYIPVNNTDLRGRRD